MKAIKVMATVDKQGQLALDQPLMADSNSRVEVIVLILEEIEPEKDDENQLKASILKDFRQAWHEAKTGQTIPVAQLWQGLGDD